MTTEPGQVELNGGESASVILHRLLLDCARAFPDTFTKIEIPESSAAFRKHYVNILPRFELARLNSDNREDITAHLVESFRQSVCWQTGPDSLSLAQHLNREVKPLALDSQQGDRSNGWLPNIIYRGQRWQRVELGDLADRLTEREVITPAAAGALRWTWQNLMDAGQVRVSGRKVVVLGGAAEMASTRQFLAAGADVLWIDRVAPPAELLAETERHGSLWWCRDNADLLTQPAEITATIKTFAAGDAVDLCLYAYAPGQAREMKLTAVMNAIAAALPTELIASINMLVSPTTPAALGEHDAACMRARLTRRPRWQASLDTLRLLGRRDNELDGKVSRTVVSIQGVSYQAAQYLGKVVMAEYWANTHTARISANTAAITKTRSLSHPVFAACFGGAESLGVETFTPRLSRQVMALLALHDWLHPSAPVPGEIRVHGGIHVLPYPLETALMIAAGIGFARSPRLLKGLVSG